MKKESSIRSTTVDVFQMQFLILNDLKTRVLLIKSSLFCKILLESALLAIHTQYILNVKLKNRLSFSLTCFEPFKVQETANITLYWVIPNMQSNVKEEPGHLKSVCNRRYVVNISRQGAVLRTFLRFHHQSKERKRCLMTPILYHEI